MNSIQKVSISFITACLILCAIKDSAGAYLCLSVGLILFGFLMWLDRAKVDRVKSLEDLVHSLKERVDLQSLRR